jgi:hypothetical protein
LSNSTAPAAPVPDLELPDWTGADLGGPRLTPEQALRLANEYLRLLPRLADARRARPAPCPVEFTL